MLLGSTVHQKEPELFHTNLPNVCTTQLLGRSNYILGFFLKSLCLIKENSDYLTRKILIFPILLEPHTI
jgi:hypothetical protein